VTDQPYRLFVNVDRTYLVRVYPDGRAELAKRDDPGAVWGPPVDLVEENVL
jgi:hypothetical protein